MTTQASTQAATLDEELEYIRRAGQGDPSAYEWLYQRHVKKIYSLVFRMVGNVIDAEEVTQEVFLQAYRGLPMFQGRSRFYTWVFRIATNLSLQHLQKLSSRRDKTSIDELLEKGRLPFFATSGEDDPEKVVAGKEFLLQLERALGQLTPNHRAVMTLGPIMGHSYEEVGEILGLSAEVVKGRLHRARLRVRELIKQHR